MLSLACSSQAWRVDCNVVISKASRTFHAGPAALREPFRKTRGPCGKQASAIEPLRKAAASRLERCPDEVRVCVCVCVCVRECVCVSVYMYVSVWPLTHTCATRICAPGKQPRMCPHYMATRTCMVDAGCHASTSRATCSCTNRLVDPARTCMCPCVHVCMCACALARVHVCVVVVVGSQLGIALWWRACMVTVVLVAAAKNNTRNTGPCRKVVSNTNKLLSCEGRNRKRRNKTVDSFKHLIIILWRLTISVLFCRFDNVVLACSQTFCMAGLPF
jgi:hypothetical protein